MQAEDTLCLKPIPSTLHNGGAMTNDPSLSTQPISISFQEFRNEEIVDFFANENRTFRPDNVGENFGRNRLVGAPHFPARQKETAAFRVSFQKPEQQEKSTQSERKGVLREKQRETVPLPTEFLEADPEILAATINEPPKRKKDITIEPSFSKPTRPLGSIVAGGNRLSNPRGNQAASVIEDPLEKERPEKKKPQKDNRPKENRPILIKLAMTGPSRLSTAAAIPTSASDASDVSPEEKLLARLRETDQQLGRLIETWPRLSPRLKETITALIEVGEKSPQNGNDNSS